MADDNTTADYIIVGAGIAGCVLASRLHERDPSLAIILIEAGADVTNHPLIPYPLSAFQLHYTEVDWNYTTVPQRYLNNRRCYLAAGKALSGGSAINYGRDVLRPPSLGYMN